MNTQLKDPRIEIGGNQPPTDPFDITKDRTNALVEAANAWLKNVKTITDVDTANACDSFLTQVKEELKASDDERKAENKPHDDAIKANNDRYRPLTALLTKIRDMLSPLKTNWLKLEAKRLADEQAARDAEALRALQEAEALKAKPVETIEQAVEVEQAEKKAQEAVKVAVTAASQKPQVRGDLAPRASGLRTYWSAEITDYPLALLHYAGRPEIRAEVQRLADADARSQQKALNVPGVEAKSEQRA